MKVHEKVIDMNVYFPDSIERVLRVLEKRERSTGKARARLTRQLRDWVLTETKMATVC